ncbi:hypothetical protein FEM48_Zijuj12G0119000 [Ziziphus jujuba var. spinosa]|uniref:W2 domain-containing protein n=1 Tax=Ziziphus jujuba var. spinosa TaxID=714518 RepID=A0A978UD62_ZIZJJ|nr:hypothetical protein FEM48_Zijuj12G0119000 [Ziziphus jujuba var. spinosa]
MRRAEKEQIREGEAADEEQKKLKKDSKKGISKASSSKKKANGSDEDRSPAHSQVDEKEEVDDVNDDDVQWQTDTSLEAARQWSREQLSAMTADMVMLSTNELEKKVATKTKTSDVAENGNSTALGRVQKGFVKEVVKKRNYLAAAVAQDEGSQLVLLRALEDFCRKSTSSALKEVALVLKALYDSDILEEECIIQCQRCFEGDGDARLKMLRRGQPEMLRRELNRTKVTQSPDGSDLSPSFGIK